VDKSSLAGIFLALGGIIAGLLLEGGNLQQIVQPTAAMIVFGGTLGAVMLQFPLPVVMHALRRLGSVFVAPKQNAQATIQRLVQFAQKARREGIVSLDADLAQIEDPFLKKSLMLAVDGTEPSELRKIMELRIQNQADAEEKVPAVFEAAGGFSPTIGIIGAVLGTLGGYQARTRLVAASGGRDLPIALLEDAIAIVGGFAVLAGTANL